MNALPLRVAAREQTEPKDGGHASVGDVDLSVLIITRNEEERIEQCILSSMEAVREAQRAGILRSVEYILVDSASTDRTVEIASRFPIRILRLEASWPLSAGAGCFVGLQHVRGVHTAIVNGDITLDRRWFVDAWPHLKPNVGGVLGVVVEDLQGRGTVERLLYRFRSVPDLVGPMPPHLANHPGGFSTGTFLLRTEAVIRAGSFNPFFRAAEDVDLRWRMMRAGWRVLAIPVLQGKHYWSSRGEPIDVRTYLRTLLRNSIGLGQMARYTLSRDAWVARRAAQPCFNARNLQGSLIGVSLAALFCANLIALLTATAWVVVALTGDAALASVVVLGNRKSRMPRSDFIFAWVLSPPVIATVRTLGFLRGFSMRPLGPSEYPREARTVRS